MAMHTSRKPLTPFMTGDRATASALPRVADARADAGEIVRAARMPPAMGHEEEALPSEQHVPVRAGEFGGA
jgi:hypothetical protein